MIDKRSLRYLSIANNEHENVPSSEYFALVTELGQQRYNYMTNSHTHSCAIKKKRFRKIGIGSSRVKKLLQSTAIVWQLDVWLKMSTLRMSSFHTRLWTLQALWAYLVIAYCSLLIAETYRYMLYIRNLRPLNYLRT